MAQATYGKKRTSLHMEKIGDEEGLWSRTVKQTENRAKNVRSSI